MLFTFDKMEHENIINTYINLLKDKGDGGFEEMINDLAFKRLGSETEGYILCEICDRMPEPYGYSYMLSHLLKTHRALMGSPATYDEY